MELINTYDIHCFSDEKDMINFLNRYNVKKKDIIKITQPNSFTMYWRVIIRNKAVSNR